MTEEWTVVETEEKVLTSPQGYAPRFVEEVPHLTVQKGQEVVMEVVVDAQPPADIAWYHDGAELHPAPDVKIFPGRNRSRLVLLRPKEGEYKAVATNRFGTTTSYGRITVQGNSFKSHACV